jgi:benzoyl-CoA-dihydrodiol lyase
MTVITARDQVTFDRDPGAYLHWRLSVEPPLAWLELNADAVIGLDSDIELHDAVQRLRFGYPEVAVVILSVGSNAAGAGRTADACTFASETLCAIEDATANSGQVYLAAVHGSCTGGGYELALACEKIIMADDATVALPDVPLAGELPPGGGLIRLTCKRGVRRDLADAFATSGDGADAATALRWRLADELAPGDGFRAAVRERALEIAGGLPPRGETAIELAPLRYQTGPNGIAYTNVKARYDRDAWLAEIAIRGPEPGAPDWLLTMTRELEDLLLRLRFNEPGLRTWLFRTIGDPGRVAASDAGSGEVAHYLKRTLKRLDVSSRSLIVLIEPESCYAGVLAEVALACDRQYMLDGPSLDDPGGEQRARLLLTAANDGPFPMASGLTRLAARFYGDFQAHRRASSAIGRHLSAAEALELGLVTAAPDDAGWADEIRLAVQTRTALPAGALTALEANLRFTGPETMETTIFGRLAAWRNWLLASQDGTRQDGANPA